MHYAMATKPMMAPGRQGRDLVQAFHGPFTSHNGSLSVVSLSSYLSLLFFQENSRDSCQVYRMIKTVSTLLFSPSTVKQGEKVKPTPASIPTGPLPPSAPWAPERQGDGADRRPA